MQPTPTNSLMLPSAVASNLPAMVRNELTRMPAQKQDEFLEEYQRGAKSKGITYLLWLFLGWHYAFLGQWGKQWLFWCTLGGFGLWWFIDLFRVSGLVDNYNKDTATNVMRNLKAIGA